jgi:eukaryotic-like serine/threonine-protein kinase
MSDHDGGSEAQRSARNWKERWHSEGELEGGGQGAARIVSLRGGCSHTSYFLKILKHQNDLERRRRMYREVAAYQTLQHPRIPKFVESNAAEYADLSFKLYMVTELVSGVTLSEYIARNGVIDVDGSLTMSTHILEVLQYCHERDWIHRDIKPDNIILRDGLPQEPVIVDFGLSFNSAEAESSKTPSFEELGNRFLRLPELSPGSPMKRDPRSDVTFCAGVLLYGLTGIDPAILIDESRRLPHQRSPTAGLLAEKVEPARLRRLLAIFDRAFDVDLNRRWQSAAELKSAIERLNDTEQTPEDELAYLRQEMERYRSSSPARNSEENSRALKIAVDALNRAVGELGPRLGVIFLISQTGYNLDPFGGWATNSFAAHRVGDTAKNWVKFTIALIGTEIVVDAESAGRIEHIFRTTADGSTFGPLFDAAVETALLRQLQADLAGLSSR